MLRRFTYFLLVLAGASYSWAASAIQGSPTPYSSAGVQNAALIAEAQGRYNQAIQKFNDVLSDPKATDQQKEDAATEVRNAKSNLNAANGSAPSYASGDQQMRQGGGNGGGEGGGGGGGPMPMMMPSPPQQQQSDSGNNNNNQQQPQQDNSAMQQQIAQLQQQVSDSKNQKDSSQQDPAQKAEADRLNTLMAQLNTPQTTKQDKNQDGSNQPDPDAQLAANDQKMLQMVQDQRMKITQNDLNTGNNNSDSSNNNNDSPPQQTGSPLGLAFAQGNSTAAFSGNGPGNGNGPNDPSSGGNANQGGGDGSGGGPGSGSGPNGNLSTTNLASNQSPPGGGNGPGGEMDPNADPNGLSTPSSGNANSVPTMPKGFASMAKQVIPTTNSFPLSLLPSVSRTPATISPQGMILGAMVHP